MKITYKGDYALKAVLALAMNYEQGGVITIHDMAKRADMPIKFLEQVLMDLKRGGFVESRRGKIGGYHLAKPPSFITVGEIVRYIDGPAEPIACAEIGYAGCKEISSCVFKSIWQDVAKATAEIIDNVTFEHLINRIKTQKMPVAYQI